MGKSISERITEVVNKSTFCYAKENGQGFVQNENCPCRIAGEVNCQAKKDKDFFHGQFNYIYERDDLSGYEKNILMIKERWRIVDSLDEDFKNRQWFKDNVVV